MTEERNHKPFKFTEDERSAIIDALASYAIDHNMRTSDVIDRIEDLLTKRVLVVEVPLDSFDK